MAKSRYIKTSFWTDPFISDLSPEEKLFYVYLLTNERVSLCGIYEISERNIIFDTNIEKEKIEVFLKKFTENQKITRYNNWIIIKNFIKHQNFKSPKIQSGINRECELLPIDLIQYLYGMDTVSISYDTLLNLTLPNYTLPNGDISNFEKDKGNPNKKKQKETEIEREDLLDLFLEHYGEVRELNHKNIDLIISEFSALSEKDKDELELFIEEEEEKKLLIQYKKINTKGIECFCLGADNFLKMKHWKKLRNIKKEPEHDRMAGVVLDTTPPNPNL